MALLDKLKQAANKVSSTVKESADALKQHKGEADELKAPVEGAIARYGVTYKGGISQYPKEKAGEIGLNIMPDSFILKATIGSRDWFADFEITYEQITSFKIIKRQAGAWEVAFSSSGSNVQDTETLNVMEITYNDGDDEIVLRLEMLTGFNVHTQAKKCQEMMDILRQNKILKRINKELIT